MEGVSSGVLRDVMDERLGHLILSSLMLVSCVSSSEEPWPEVSRGEGELEARRIVWQDHLQMDDKIPPEVFWSTGLCPGHPFPHTAVVIDEMCYAGYFRPDMWRIDVAWEEEISDSAYAHEFIHAWQWLRGISDPQHLNDDWKLVPEINASLKKKGL